MIESLLNPERAERRPWEAFLAGLIITLVACLLSMQIGTSAPSNCTGIGGGFLTVALISIAAAPFFTRLFSIEEEKHTGGNLFTRHKEILKIFGAFFIGVVIGSSLFYIINPGASERVLSDQINDLKAKNIISGDAVRPTAGFEDILWNNSKVLGLTFLFSFMLGAGAIFLISWNASVIGVLVAKIAENPVAFGAVEIAKGDLTLNYLAALPFTLLRLLPHGIFEISGFFLGAVAGGVLSVGIIRESDPKHKFIPVFKDALAYLFISWLLVLIGAVVEVVLV